MREAAATEAMAAVGTVEVLVLFVEVAPAAAVAEAAGAPAAAVRELAGQRWIEGTW